MNKILFVITGSIAASKCKDIMASLNLNKYQISCVLTEEAKKYIKITELKKYLGNRLFTDKSEKKKIKCYILISQEIMI